MSDKELVSETCPCDTQGVSKGNSCTGRSLPTPSRLCHRHVQDANATTEQQQQPMIIPVLHIQDILPDSQLSHMDQRQNYPKEGPRHYTTRLIYAHHKTSTLQKDKKGLTVSALCAVQQCKLRGLDAADSSWRLVNPKACPSLCVVHTWKACCV